MLRRTLARGRRKAESLMTDSVRGVLADRTGDPVWDEETRTDTYPSAVVYADPDEPAKGAPGRLRLGGGQARAADNVGQQVTIQRGVLSLPIATSGDVTVGAEFEVLASETDPALVGHKVRVVGGFDQTHATARRLQVETYE